MRKGVLFLLTVISTLAPISCEDSTLFIDCNKCFESLGDKINIELKLTIDFENSFIPITFYQGNVDNGQIISRDTAYSSSFYTQEVEYGKTYSAVAKYSHQGRVIYVVDGKELRKKLDKNSCANPCYLVLGDVLDLRLK
jgi:hypothetical protein